MRGSAQKVSLTLAIFCLLTIFSNGVCGQQGGRTYTAPAKPKPAPAKPKALSKAPAPDKQSTSEPEEAVKKVVPPKVIPQLVRIPAGTFAMGSAGKQPNESPVHKVEMDSFEIGLYEVTNQEFEAFVTATNYQTDAERQNDPVTWRSYYQAGREDYPVVLVSWQDASMYCKWLSEATNENFRLPTEAEWEYAARGGLAAMNYPWGAKIDERSANYDDKGERIVFTGVALDFVQPVGCYVPNGYGLFDVAGNVWEWCSDWYDENYYRVSPSNNPKGPETGSFKVMRGGGWVNDGNSCRVSFRNFNATGFTMPYIGFRVVKAPQQNSTQQPAIGAQQK